MGQQIKYLGSSHNRVLEKGEDFGGRLSEPLTKTVEWTLENGHLVDAEEAGLSETALELLLEDEEFKDVTDLARVPTSLGQQLWKGAKKTEHDAQGDVPAQVSDDDEPPSKTGKAENTEGTSEASDTAPASPGGSTSSAPGPTRAGRRG